MPPGAFSKYDRTNSSFSSAGDAGAVSEGSSSWVEFEDVEALSLPCSRHVVALPGRVAGLLLAVSEL